MPDSDKLLSLLLKLGFAMLALLVARDVVFAILERTSWEGLVLGFVALTLVSPVAYLILESGERRPEHRARRGAERTPLLPPDEED